MTGSLLMTNACMICTQKHRTYRLDKIRQIARMLEQNGVKPAKTGWHIEWGNHARCRLGIPCHILDDFNRRCDRECEEPSRYLKAVAHEANDNVYYETLHLLQGEFPMAYRMLERKRRKNGRKKNLVGAADR